MYIHRLLELWVQAQTNVTRTPDTIVFQHWTQSWGDAIISTHPTPPKSTVIKGTSFWLIFLQNLCPCFLLSVFELHDQLMLVRLFYIRDVLGSNHKPEAVYPVKRFPWIFSGPPRKLWDNFSQATATSFHRLFNWLFWRSIIIVCVANSVVK
jgi:hypothetical protein